MASNTNAYYGHASTLTFNRNRFSGHECIDRHRYHHTHPPTPEINLSSHLRLLSAAALLEKPLVGVTCAVFKFQFGGGTFFGTCTLCRSPFLSKANSTKFAPPTSTQTWIDALCHISIYNINNASNVSRKLKPYIMIVHSVYRISENA